MSRDGGRLLDFQSHRSFLDAGRRHGLGEPSSVAHSAMMLLALSAWHLPAAPRATANADTEGGAPALQQRRRQLMAHLAEGILHQQRADGSFRVGGAVRRRRG